MQINTKIQIVMDQSDIEAAILAALYEKFPHLKGTELSIKLIGGRGDAGHRAEIEGVQEASEPVVPVVPAYANAQRRDSERQQEVPKDDGLIRPTPENDEDKPPFPEQASEPEKEEVKEPEQPARGIFRQKTKTDEAASSDAPSEEAPKGKGLFGALARPDNRS